MSSSRHPFHEAPVEAAFAAFPTAIRPKMLQLRDLIFETGAEMENVGRIEESLKWGQPSYRATDPATGTAVRLGCPKSGGYAIFTHCQTSIIADHRARFGDEFRYDGNRAVLFDDIEPPPLDKLRPLIAHALTYRRGRRAPA